MKICHVITRLIIGGAQENTILTCKGLVARGHEVTLIAGPETGPEGSLWPMAESAGCQLIKLDSMCRAISPLSDRQALRELTAILRDQRPEVVHTHSSKAGILGRYAARNAGIPVIIHTIHGMSFNRTQPAYKQWLYRTLERRAARFTTGFITVADAMIDQAVAAGIAPREKFVTIRSGLDTGLFAPDDAVRREVRAGWGVRDDEVVVGTVARLFENKGYDEIIAAMGHIFGGSASTTANADRDPARIRFVWIGDGAHRQRYESRLTQMGLRDRVTFTGLISLEEVGRQIKGFDIVLHASRWEGLPRALVQGLLTEVPAVSFDNDGAPEVVIDGETGFLIPYGNTDALADAIVLLAADPHLRRRLGQAGRNRCQTMFDWGKMVQEIEACYLRFT